MSTIVNCDQCGRDTANKSRICCVCLNGTHWPEDKIKHCDEPVGLQERKTPDGPAIPNGQLSFPTPGCVHWV